jgi:YidC/Oxa1 family membrane protein insertase
MSLRHHNDIYHQFFESFGDHPLFKLDNSFSSSATLLESDLIVSDWSGAAHDFALGLLRPAIFMDTPQKAHNDIYPQLNIECYEDVVREELGALVSLHQADSLPDVVNSLLDDRIEWQQRLKLLRSQVLFNPGEAITVAAMQILDLIT